MQNEKYKEYIGEIPHNTLRTWYAQLMADTPWQHVGWAGAAKEPFRHWAAYPEFGGLIKTIWDCMNFSFKQDGFNIKPDRVIMNLYNHGDSSWLHKDTDKPSWTAMIYMNDYWDLNWGGDTVLVEDNEIVKAFAATPGKFIIFRGDMLHGARPVSREAPYPRFGIAFQCVEDIQGSAKDQVSSLHSPLQ